MKFIHFSDTHVGVESSGRIDPDTRINVRVLDYLDTIDAIVDFAEDENIDLAIFTGDAFHVNKPNPIYLNEFSKRISRLSRQCPVVMIVGNHDMARLHTSSAVEIYSSLNIPNIVVGNRMEIFEVDTKAGMVQVLSVPYPTKELLGEGISGKTDDKISKNISDSLKMKLASMCKNLKKTSPAILAGHLTVLGSISGSESSYSIGLNPDIDLEELAKPCFNYVALGHIHKYQNLTEGREKVPPVIYSGSVERVSFNEEHEDKGFILAEISEGKTSYEFILVGAREFVTLEIFSEDRDPTKMMLKKISKLDLSGKIVRYIIHVPEEFSYLVDDGKIQAAISDAGAFSISSRKIDIIKVARETARSSGFSVNCTTEELLSKYFDLKGYDAKEQKKLMSIASDIIKTVENTA